MKRAKHQDDSVAQGDDDVLQYMQKRPNTARGERDNADEQGQQRLYEARQRVREAQESLQQANARFEVALRDFARPSLPRLLQNLLMHRALGMEGKWTKDLFFVAQSACSALTSHSHEETARKILSEVFATAQSPADFSLPTLFRLLSRPQIEVVTLVWMVFRKRWKMCKHLARKICWMALGGSETPSYDALEGAGAVLRACACLSNGPDWGLGLVRKHFAQHCASLTDNQLREKLRLRN